MSTEPASRLDETEPVREGKSFPRRFGRKVGALLAVACFLILLFGLISLWFSERILEDSERIRHLNDHIRMMERIHINTHLLLEATEDRMAHRKGASEQIHALGKLLLKEFEGYETEHDLPNVGWLKEGNEKLLFEEIRGRVVEVVKLAFAAGEHGEEIKAKVEALTPRYARMAAIHERVASEVDTQNRNRMRWLLEQYFLLAVVGVLIIIGGIFWVVHSIVRPVKRLAAAVQEVAHGDFAKRVEVTSRDEIGQLSHTFNLMAERLEEHQRFVQRTATLEERERLAREMHDGLAQSISHLKFEIAYLQRGLSAGEKDCVEEGFRVLKETVENLYNEVRQAIFGLRVMVSRQPGLLPSLTEYLHVFSRETGIHVDLLNEDGRVDALPPETEVQLIRIIQEALTNVRKHAQASRVTITFRKAGENLETIIADNGRGISQARASAKEKATFGLQTMDERARSVGGSFEVRDASSLGTQLTICLPVAPVGKGARPWTG